MQVVEFDSVFELVDVDASGYQRAQINNSLTLEPPRLDLTHETDPIVYTIDPEGCTDADDAFSVWDDGENVHLRIHIADPTAYLSPCGDLLKHIIQTAQTKYSFGMEPEHLFPKVILDRCSLVEGSRKKVVTVHAVFQPTNISHQRWQLKTSNIEYGIINCATPYRFTYEQAATRMYTETAFLLGSELAVQLWRDRTQQMPWMHQNGTLFNDMSLVIPRPGTDGPLLIADQLRVKLMKSMIAEFAIHANTVFARGLSDTNVFLRTAQLPVNITGCEESLNQALSGQDLLHKIIINQVSATYTSLKLPHDIVSCDLYTHSTSPLRRASDCIVHLLLKAQALQAECPFSEEQLRTWSAHLTAKAKSFRQAQFASIKLETLRWLKKRIETDGPVTVTYLVSSHCKGFLNMLITNINELPVNISYTLKRNTNSSVPVGQSDKVIITKVILNNKFDEGTLPDLDLMFPK